ncbi:hypothetical protein HDU93_004819 [Gonapodya sp. JEL0774]|nr:hypothetical protein HDU93_004819 [Gonapodya sp. JEL0774]
MVVDKDSLAISQSLARSKMVCDYALAVLATSENTGKLGALSRDAAHLHINHKSVKPNLQDLVSHFKSWPEHSPIIVNAHQTDLTSILFVANLHKRRIHVTNIVSKDDIQVIVMAKESGMNVTCDVPILNLFFSKRDFKSEALGTAEDVAALWENLEWIDCLSVGDVAYRLALDQGRTLNSAIIGVEAAVPLLFTAVADGRMTLDDVVTRLSINPRKIFEIPEQTDTYVEIEVDRSYVASPVSAGIEWSPIAGRLLKASVHRVVVRGSTLYLDGSSFAEAGTGRDISGIISVINNNAGLLVAPSGPRDNAIVQSPRRRPTLVPVSLGSQDLSLSPITRSQTLSSAPANSRDERSGPLATLMGGSSLSGESPLPTSSAVAASQSVALHPILPEIPS